MLNSAKQTIRRMRLKYKKSIMLIPFRSVSEKLELTVITGADSSHFKSLLQFIKSLLKHEPYITILVYNLGLISSEIETLRSLFPAIIVRNFEYDKYPKYFNINEQAGQYAWKPVIVNEVMTEFRTAICWMDAGNVVTSPLTNIRRILNLRGFYSPHSSGTISEWTHPGTLRYLNVNPVILGKRNLNGACVAANYNNKMAVELIEKWCACALIKDCIAPEGSSRSNHRQDQAVLSVLAHTIGIANNIPKLAVDFLTHQDVDNQ